MRIWDKIGLITSSILIVVGLFLKYQENQDYFAYILAGSICLIGFSVQKLVGLRKNKV